MKNFIVVTNTYERTKRVTESIIEQFEEAGFCHVKENPDFVLVLGGDGTFLDACHKISYSSDILCIGINFGTLGYFLDISNHQIRELIEYLKKTPKEELLIEEIHLLQAKFFQKEKKDPIIKYATNEIVLLGDLFAKFDIHLSTDNGFVQDVSTSTFMVSTSTGSTGISKSNDGPIMLGEYPLLIASLNLPICHSKVKNFIPNSLIYSNFTVDIIENYQKLRISLDGKEVKDMDVNAIERIELAISNNRIKKLNFCRLERGAKIREKMIRD